MNEAAVPAGSRIRARFTLQSLEEGPGELHVTWAITVEREGGEKTCCVAEWLLRYYAEDTSLLSMNDLRDRTKGSSLAIIRMFTALPKAVEAQVHKREQTPGSLGLGLEITS